MESPLDSVREKSGALIEKYFDCIQNEALVKQFLLAPRDVSVKTDNWRVAYQYVRWSLFDQFMLSTANLVTDRDSRALSLHRIVALIEQPEVKQALEQFYDRPKRVDVVMVNVDPGLAEETREEIVRENQESSRQRFEARYPRVVSEANALLASCQATKMRDYRCRIVAHYEMTRDGRPRRLVRAEEINLTWREPFDFFSRAGELIVDVYELTFDSSYHIDSYRSECELNAKCFHDSLSP